MSGWHFLGRLASDPHNNTIMSCFSFHVYPLKSFIIVYIQAAIIFSCLNHCNFPTVIAKLWGGSSYFPY